MNLFKAIYRITQTQFENKMLFFTQILNKRCLIFQLKTFEVY